MGWFQVGIIQSSQHWRAKCGGREKSQSDCRPETLIFPCPWHCGSQTLRFAPESTPLTIHLPWVTKYNWQTLGLFNLHSHMCLFFIIINVVCIEMNEVYYMCYLCSFYLKNLAMATNLTTPSFQIQEGMQVENSEV